MPSLPVPASDISLPTRRRLARKTPAPNERSRQNGNSAGLDPTRFRKRLETAIERMIVALDAMDADPDLEEGHDAEAMNEDGGDVQDDPHDGEGDDEDSLGSPTLMGCGNQEYWAQGLPDDREDDPDDNSDDHDLGADEDEGGRGGHVQKASEDETAAAREASQPLQRIVASLTSAGQA